MISRSPDCPNMPSSVNVRPASVPTSARRGSHTTGIAGQRVEEVFRVDLRETFRQRRIGRVIEILAQEFCLERIGRSCGRGIRDLLARATRGR
jgi:hypothetical protein